MAESGIATERQTISFLWTIKDFRNWYLDEDCCSSTRHLRVVKHLDKNLLIKFKLWCSSNWELCVQMVTQSANGNFDASIEVSLLDTDFCLFHVKYKKHTFSKIKTAICFSNYIDSDIVLNNDNKLLHNGNLVMYIEVSYDAEPHEKHKRYGICCAPEIDNIRSILHLLLEKENFPDFTVRVKDKNFLCHKCVLACRCEYFGAMFRSKLKENDESSLVLTDIEDPSIFEKLLRYVYTGEADVSETEAFLLLVAADKYGLKRLKALCEEKIHSNLCLENALEIFAFASVHSLENLKSKSFLIVTVFTHVLISEFLSNFAGYAERDSKSDEGTTAEDSMQKLTSNLVINPELPIGESVSLRCKTGSKRTFLPKIDVWCRTDLTLLGKNTWKIKNFKNCDFWNLETLSSCTVDCDRISWEIEARTSTTYNYGEEFTELFLCLKYASSSSKAFSPYIQYKFSILNVEGKETNTISGSCRKAEEEFLKIHFFDDVNTILSSDDLLHGEDLVVCCKFYIPKSDWCHINAGPAVPECSIVDDISSLLGNESFTDAIIKIGGERFPCHKAILSCYSSFLHSKFLESSSEETVIEIDDINPTTFRKILSAMYTGRCEFSATEVWELLPLEDKYCFFNTTSTFDEAFISALSTENAVKALVLTASQKSMKLQKYALEFISRNSQNILQSGLMQ